MSFDERNLPVVRDHFGSSNEGGMSPIFPWENSAGDLSECTPSELHDVIKRHWHSQVASILVVGGACAHVNTWEPSKKDEFIEGLPFRRSTFSKLASIGADRRLRDERVKPLLPPKYTTLYQITLLNDEELEAALRESLIKPDLEREELETWVSEHRGTTKSRRKDGSQPPAPNKQASCGSGDGETQTSSDHNGSLSGDLDALVTLRAEWEKAESLKTAWINAPHDVREQFAIEVLELRLSQTG